MKTLNKNYGTDTIVSQGLSLKLDRGIPNFGADFKTRTDEPSEVILTNLNSPVAYPENFRFATSKVANIYKGTGIAATSHSQVSTGTNVLCQLTETWTVQDDTDPNYCVALPVSAHIVLKVPDDPMITVDDITGLLGRAISGLFETGSTSGHRIQALLRGSLKPSDI